LFKVAEQRVLLVKIMLTKGDYN